MPKQPPSQGTKEPAPNTETAEVFKEEQPTESQEVTPNPFKTPSNMGIDVVEV